MHMLIQILLILAAMVIYGQLKRVAPAIFV